MQGPIKPSEIAEGKVKYIPEEVFQSFNELISRNYCNGFAKVYTKDVLSLLFEKGISKEIIYSKDY